MLDDLITHRPPPPNRIAGCDGRQSNICPKNTAMGPLR
jgi:hypothetical protein